MTLDTRSPYIAFYAGIVPERTSRTSFRHLREIKTPIWKFAVRRGDSRKIRSGMLGTYPKMWLRCIIMSGQLSLVGAQIALREDVRRIYGGVVLRAI